MSKRRRARLAVRASVALATSGLTSCNDIGGVDPPPPPIVCDSSTAEGLTLEATGSLSGRELQIYILPRSMAYWTEVSIYAVTGGTAQPVTPGPSLTIVIDLADDSVTTGSFTLSGVLHGDAGGTCRVVRTFTFTIQPSGVTVARGALPLERREAVRIALVRREGLDVELEAASPGLAPGALRWRVTGGRILSHDGTRLRWQLPDQVGLHQAELVVDHGQRGLSFDTLALAVEPPDADDGSAT